MLALLPPAAASVAWELKLGGAETGQYPPKLGIVLERALLLFAGVVRLSLAPSTFPLTFSVDPDLLVSRELDLSLPLKPRFSLEL